MKKYDLVVIGGGSGGIATANRAAEYGAKVAVIEGDRLGGTCVNIGCVPKKVSWYAAFVSDAIHTYGPGYGFAAENVQFDYSKFLESRDAYVDRSRSSYDTQFANRGVEVYQEFGRFIANDQVQVGSEVITADNFVIATGGRPYIPNVPGADLIDTSNDFFAWKELPESVVVVGAGYIGVELSGVLKALGVKDVSLYEYSDRPLPNFDEMLQDAVIDGLKDLGVNFYPSTSFDGYQKNGELIECLIDGEVVASAEKVLLTAGRIPNSDQVGLENTDVQVDERGAIVVNEGHQTAVANIYAIGDVINRINLTPVAIRAGRQLAEYLYNHAETSEIDYTNVPSVVFAHPALGTIGMTEYEAVEEYGADNVRIYRADFYSMYTSAANKREACRFKLVTLGKEEKIIGLHGSGKGVDEMIQGFGVAIKMGATKADFDSVVAIHPTGSEEFVTMR